jgi:uncharacterized membrane protein YhiD involved in acid resistance
MQNDSQTNFSDIFNSSFIEKTTDFSILDTVIGLVLAFLIGSFIFIVYKKTFKGVMYSASFGISLVSMAMITTLVIMAVTSNVVLSLGMVGALSIVRFRSAIKEPMDIAFLFWAVGSGIVLGAGLIPLAIIGSIFIGIIIIIFSNKKVVDNPYMLVINCNSDLCENEVMNYLKTSVKKYLIKSKSVSRDNNIELTIEVKITDMSTEFVNRINAIKGVANAVLVSYNGEYMS